MSRTPPPRTISRATGAALTAGFGMIPLHRLPPAVRTAYVVLPAAFTTGVVLAALRRAASRVAHTAPEADASRRASRRTVVRVALPVVVGGLTAGAGAASIVIDRGIENALRRHGMPAPRIVMGLGAGALSLALDVLADRGGDEGSDEGGAVPEGGAEPEGGAAPTSPPSAR